MEPIIQADMDKLRTDMLTTFRLAEAAVRRALDAVFERSAADAEAVIEGDAAIDNLECALDAEVLRLLALYQPVARDLRYIVGCMRAVGDIERIGDQAVSIAERGLALLSREPVLHAVKLDALAAFTLEYLGNTAKAFGGLDNEMAKRLCAESEEALEQNESILTAMAEYMIGEARTVERAVEVCFIAHSLKRICDQCSNIAESVIFIREGACSRHRCD